MASVRVRLREKTVETASVAESEIRAADVVTQRFVAAKPTLERKKLVRRDSRDLSQPIRRAIQIVFFVLNVWIGVQFYLWVRWTESGGQSAPVSRPAGVEGWLPIEGLMQFKYVLCSGRLPSLHPAAFFLFAAFVFSSLLFRKSFCGWLCPIGTISEYLWKFGRYIFRGNIRLPRWLDLPLRSLKYVLLGFFAYAVVMMSADAIAEFVASPYGLLVDVRMLNFFRFPGSTTAVVIGVLVVASVFVQNFWCRYLCPYGALMGLVALASPARITRRENACIDCAKCAKACPSALPVDKLIQIRSAECTGCLECVAACPAKDALEMEFTAPFPAPPRLRRSLPAWSVAAGIAIIFVGLVGFAKLTNHWETRLPEQVFLQLVPATNEQQHPVVDQP